MRVGHEELEDAAVAENDAATLVDELVDVFADDRTKGGGGGGLEQMEDVARPDAALEELWSRSRALRPGLCVAAWWRRRGVVSR